MKKTKITKKVKAWAIYAPHIDSVMEVGFIGEENIKITKRMFVNEDDIPQWQGVRYKLIPCTITYQFPSKKKVR
jgi:hypothetical protein